MLVGLVRCKHSELRIRSRTDRQKDAVHAKPYYGPNWISMTNIPITAVSSSKLDRSK